MANVQTPRRRKVASQVNYDIGDVASPSQLGMRSLRLSPGPAAASSGEAFDEVIVFATQLTPRRGRQRLVDRLDAPSSQIEESRSPSRSGSPKSPSKVRLKVSPARPPKLVKESSFEIRTDDDEQSLERREPLDSIAKKTKRSYAQARSHLSDLTREESFRSASSAGNASLDLSLSQLESQAPLKSQLDMEESDEEDPTAGSKTKSIHELRRAGANNRFEREVEHIFEDIESLGQASRSLRLHALIQLVNKLSTPRFAIQFLDAQLEPRLSSSASRELDSLSSMLFMATFFMLANVDASTKLSRKMQQAVIFLSVTLLMEKRSFAALAKDRKKNLSKASIRDLIDCEEKLLAQAVRFGSSLERLTPQVLSMSTLALMVKRLRLEGQPFVNNSQAFLKEVTQVLEGSISRLEANMEDAESLFLVKAAVTFLESSRQSASALVYEDLRGLSSFTETLGKALRVSGKVDTGLQQMTLRMVVNLSNNDSKLSTNFTDANILDEIVTIVETDFDQLARSADAGEEIDARRLDSVILALGCLLNLVECSPEARHKMMLVSFRLRYELSSFLTLFRPRTSTKLKLWLLSAICQSSFATSA